MIVIHGPGRTGKTVHARRFAEHYGCSRIVDIPHSAPCATCAARCGMAPFGMTTMPYRCGGRHRLPDPRQ